MTFTAIIRQLRDNAGKSQETIAEAIGIARATYASLEAGRRPPNLDEMTKLAEYYQIAPSALIDGVAGIVSEPVVEYVREASVNDIEPREIDPQVNPEKLREVLLYILNKIGAKPNVGEAVLYKLLYFIDMDYYEKYGRSITGLTYIHNTYGPSPMADFKSIVNDMVEHGELEILETKYFKNNQKKYLPNKTADLAQLDARELQHVDEELLRLADKSATELSELSHQDTPWIVTPQGKPIDYRGVFYRTYRTAVTEFEDEL